jgi:hypothetical protein
MAHGEGPPRTIPLAVRCVPSRGLAVRLVIVVLGVGQGGLGRHAKGLLECVQFALLDSEPHGLDWERVGYIRSSQKSAVALARASCASRTRSCARSATGCCGSPAARGRSSAGRCGPWRASPRSCSGACASTTPAVLGSGQRKTPRLRSFSGRAADEARTRDPQLGKLMLYQLSYRRVQRKA